MVCGGPLIPKTKIKILNYTVNLFSVKVLNEDTIFASSFLCGHPRHAKVLAVCKTRQYLRFTFLKRP